MHLCTLCPVTAARRDRALGNGALAEHLGNIADAVYVASGRRLNRDTLQDLIDALPVHSSEARFITSHIVTGSPWPASAADPTWPLALRLGAFFDTDIRQSLASKVANAWALAAYEIATTVAFKWWALLPPASRATLEAAGHIVPT